MIPRGLPEGELVRVLFVCLGNICRSPTALAVFRKLVAEAGLEAEIACDSAGLSDYHEGEPPDPRAAAAARKRGFDLNGIQARGIGPKDFLDFDHMLAMDRQVYRRLLGMRRLMGEPTGAKIAMFLDHAPDCGTDEVPDPYTGEEEHFEEVLDLIEEGAEGLLENIRRENAR
jgi:low molecular weight protein-tyrosine phosphatase